MSLWSEQVENYFVKNINDTYTLNLAISILEDRENFREEIERLNKELQDTKEHLGEYLHEQEEENKRLNNKVEELENEPLTNKISRIDSVVANIYRENKRLNNIINELEKWLEEEIDCYDSQEKGVIKFTYCDIMDKLQELKGSE